MASHKPQFCQVLLGWAFKAFPLLLGPGLE